VQFAQIGNCAEITTNGFHNTINGVLYKEQERLKSELKSKTAELDLLTAKLQRNYALGKKTVKMAEPQVNWVAYGITDKK